MCEFEKLSSGNVNDVNWEKLKPIYGRIAEDIGFQKKRIGGNFVVANAVTSCEMRNKRLHRMPASKRMITKKNKKSNILETIREGKS